MSKLCIYLCLVGIVFCIVGLSTNHPTAYSAATLCFFASIMGNLKNR